MTDTTQAQDATTDDVQDTTAADQAETAQDATTDQPTGFDALPKETQEEIRALRRENAKYRKAAKDATDAEKTELERLSGERDDYKSRYERLESQYRETRAEAAFIEAATKANARSPRTLFRAYRADVAYDDDGAPTNIADLVATLLKEEPDLFRIPEGDGGKGGDSVANDDFNTMIRRAAGRKG